MSQLMTPYGDHLCNPELVKEARRKMSANFTKLAFVPGGDPSMTGGGGAPPPGGDPSMGGGAPPMDPSMMGGPPPGGDPSGGGAPPMDPSMMGMPPMPPPGGGGGGDPAMTAKMDQILQAVQGGSAQSGSNMAGQIKPKIDVNVAIMQMSKMIARIADALGVKIPASEMIATPTDLTQMAAKQQSGGQQDSAMGAPGGMPPMGGQPDMGGAPPGGGGKAAADAGVAYSHKGLEETMNKAAMIASLRRRPAA